MTFEEWWNTVGGDLAWGKGLGQYHTVCEESPYFAAGEDEFRKCWEAALSSVASVEETEPVRNPHAAEG